MALNHNPAYHLPTDAIRKTSSIVSHLDNTSPQTVHDMASFALAKPRSGADASSSRSASPRASNDGANGGDGQRSGFNPQLMFVGQACHLDSCRREDFLPWRCPYCHHSHCAEHAKPQHHDCARFGQQEASEDFRVPLCPLCHAPPLGWRRDQDPNIAMEAHLTPRPDGTVECTKMLANGLTVGEGASSTTPAPRQKRPNECRDKKCRKIMVVPIECPSCHLAFCPSHRTPASHACAAASASSSSAKSRPGAAASATKTTTGRTAKPSTTSGLGGFFQQIGLGSTSDNSGRAKESTPASGNTAPSVAAPAVPKGGLEAKLGKLDIAGAMGLSKADRRATAETKSQLRALQERDRRGLLSAREKVLLAELMAGHRESIAEEKRRQQGASGGGGQQGGEGGRGKAGGGFFGSLLGGR